MYSFVACKSKLARLPILLPKTISASTFSFSIEIILYTSLLTLNVAPIVTSESLRGCYTSRSKSMYCCDIFLLLMLIFLYLAHTMRRFNSLSNLKSSPLFVVQKPQSAGEISGRSNTFKLSNI